jgi:hypothetical protein
VPCGGEDQQRIAGDHTVLVLLLILLLVFLLVLLVLPLLYYILLLLLLLLQLQPLITIKLQVITVRCYGYDSPEMKPPLKDLNRDTEIAAARAAKAALENFVLNKICVLKLHGLDKYGRFLATIYTKRWCQSTDVCREMVETGHGVEYFGGKKKPKEGGATELNKL